jgi:SpoVK/Ycf46/Vps4 family AAA+-type ATPase
MWMQEQTQQVFVVATANSIQNLPPELLRRGRFDELFFIDLPNYQERLQILNIHLVRRGWKPEKLRVAELAQRTDGYSGAELEQLIAAAIIDAFGHGQVLSDEILDRTRRSLVPLSRTMEERIFELRQWAQDRCRRATSDNRAAQMLEEETRLGAVEPEDQAPVGNFRWELLADAGQLKAAIVEFVRQEGEVTLAATAKAFGKFLAVEGDIGLALKSDPQTVLWVGLSPEFSEVLIELIANRRIYVQPTTADSYADATPPRLPVLSAPASDKVSRPHWLPVLLRNRPSQYTQQLSRLRRIQLSRAGRS